VFALASGTFSPTLNYASAPTWLPDEPAIAFVVLLAAGTVMGFGARLAGGCTSGPGEHLLLAHRRRVVTPKLSGLIVGLGFGFVISWARLTDPTVIRDMLLLRDPHVFLIMGSAVLIAGAGVRLARKPALPCVSRATLLMRRVYRTGPP
jgi:uncharacterized membrane protein YedE/YeeE